MINFKCNACGETLEAPLSLQGSLLNAQIVESYTKYLK